MSVLTVGLFVFAGLWLATIIASTVYVTTEKSYLGSAAIGIILLGWGWPFFVFIIWPFIEIQDFVLHRVLGLPRKER